MHAVKTAPAVSLSEGKRLVLRCVGAKVAVTSLRGAKFDHRADSLVVVVRVADVLVRRFASVNWDVRIAIVPQLGVFRLIVADHMFFTNLVLLID